jgi:hypothetical protein
MHKQDSSDTGKGTDVLTPKIVRLSEKVNGLIDDHIQIKRVYEGRRINNITFWVGRQKRGRLFSYPECGGPISEGSIESTGNEKNIDCVVGLARRRMEPLILVNLAFRIPDDV